MATTMYTGSFSVFVDDIFIGTGNGLEVSWEQVKQKRKRDFRGLDDQLLALSLRAWSWLSTNTKQYHA